MRMALKIAYNVVGSILMAVTLYSIIFIIFMVG